MTACVLAKWNFENSFTAIQSVWLLKFLHTAAIPMDAGFLHDKKAAMLRDMKKTHPITQAWSVSYQSVCAQEILYHIHHLVVIVFPWLNHYCLISCSYKVWIKLNTIRNPPTISLYSIICLLMAEVSTHVMKSSKFLLMQTQRLCTCVERLQTTDKSTHKQVSKLQSSEMWHCTDC